MNNQHSSAALRPANRQTLAGHVYEELQRAIIEGLLPPGQKLVIDQIAKQMNVSITPVREALMRLLREGLVSEVPYSGLHVTRLSNDDLRELWSIRGVLEGYAVKLAANALSAADLVALKEDLDLLEDARQRGDGKRFREINYQFHARIYAVGAGRLLMEQISQVTRNTRRYRNLQGVIVDQKYLDDTQEQHRRLYQLLTDRCADEAEMLMRQHSLTSYEHFHRFWEARHEDRQG